MQPVHEMPVVVKIIAQLLYDNNLQIKNYIIILVVSSDHPSSMRSCCIVIVAMKLLR